MFPDASNRWCTSDFKRGPVRRLMTAQVREAEDAGHPGRVRILNVMAYAPTSPRPGAASSPSPTTER
jgi:hypothetical protein